MTDERPATEGGVFIPTNEIYNLLRQSIDQTNARMIEIRGDINQMNTRIDDSKVVERDHEKRIRTLETTKKDRLSPSVTSALIAAPIAIIGILAPMVIK
ncbi:hypothetical protein [Actinomadura sp. WMMB 499]|uniref:hypothetical protein n=1 Tax=Actinomadura sp. WMMB 499 TaxID=1219491 RepID=UPI0012475A07|nr:hypothetical protein [Actinomadura sp. WMMB 499]QFG25441.1 hypothetical protein F7P10_34055 [Actinomadura sp. WMMB 499]